MTLIRGFNYPRPHDTTHSPLGLWQLDGDLTDDSGNSYDLTVLAGQGPVRYVDLGGGMKGFYSPTADPSGAYRNAADAALRLAGALTIECLAAYETPPSSHQPTILSHGHENATVQGDNILYCFRLAGGPFKFRYYAQEGVVNSITYTIDDCPRFTELYHLAMVRSSDEVTFYLNGEQVGATSVGLSAPDGGTNGRLSLGATYQDGTNMWAGALASVKLIGSALTAAQVREEYRRTLG